MTEPDPVRGHLHTPRDLQFRHLTATIAELEAALAEARTDQACSRRFLADAAHQLRTPLAGVLASAEALLRGQDDDEGDRLFANLVRETARSVRLAADLRALARLDDLEGLSPCSIDLVAVCREEIGRVWSLAPQLDVVLRVPALAWSAELDDRAVREILANVLDNARRHAHARIVVAIVPGEQSVDIRVADDGFGVAPDAVDAIFGRFVSLDGLGGCGLGLPIARDLARACGGDLVYSGGGFVISLPVSEKNM